MVEKCGEHSWARGWPRRLATPLPWRLRAAERGGAGPPALPPASRHFSWDAQVDGIRYVQWPLGYPHEHRRRSGRGRWGGRSHASLPAAGT